jgi:hypothetical protein
MEQPQRWEEFMDQDIIDAQTERIAELEAVEAAARRMAVAYSYFRDLTDYVEFEVAYAELCDLLDIPTEER